MKLYPITKIISIDRIARFLIRSLNIDKKSGFFAGQLITFQSQLIQGILQFLLFFLKREFIGLAGEMHGTAKMNGAAGKRQRQDKPVPTV